MKRTNLLIFTLLLMVLGCKDKPKDNIELKVYSSVIDSLINYKKYYRPAPSPNLILKDLAEKKLKKEQSKYDSILNEFDTKFKNLNKYLFINDTYQKINIKDLKDRLKSEKVYNFINNSKYEIGYDNKELKIRKLQKESDILLIPESYPVKEKIIDTFGIKNKNFYLGYLSLSSPVFNNEYTRCILMVDFICGYKCGVKKLVFIEKKNGIWEIVNEIELLIY